MIKIRDQENMKPSTKEVFYPSPQIRKTKDPNSVPKYFSQELGEVFGERVRGN